MGEEQERNNHAASSQSIKVRQTEIRAGTARGSFCTGTKVADPKTMLTGNQEQTVLPANVRPVIAGQR